MRDIDAILKSLKALRGTVIGRDDTGLAAAVNYHGADLRVICSWGEGWDHVSVSLQHRTPTWAEMCMVKDMCFEPYQAAMQLHPAQEDHINCHEFCLHIWRPHIALGLQVPKPPKYMV